MKKKSNCFLAATSLVALSTAVQAEQWTKSDSLAWTNAASWTDSVAGDPAPPGSDGGTYTNVRLNLQGGTTTYTSTEGTQTYDVSGAGGETRALFMTNTGTAASSTLTMTGGELIFVQDGANTAVGLNNTSAATTATLNLDGGKLTINETDTNSDTQIAAGFGANGVGVVNLNSGGTLTSHQVQLGASIGTTGTLNLNSGGLLVTNRIYGNGGTSALVIDGGTIQIRSAASPNLIAASLDSVTIQGGGFIVDTAGFDGTIAKALAAGTGSGGLTKNGAGTLSLGDTNTYSGVTTVNAGTLSIGTGGTTGSLLAGNTLVLATDTTLAINRSDALSQSTFTGAGSTFQSGLGGGVNFTKAGGNTFTADVANSHTGATTISGGTLLVTHISALGAAGGANAAINGATLALSGGITLAGEDITVSAGQGNNFRGVLQSFSGSNTFSGNVTVVSTTSETRIGSQDDASLTLGGNLTAAGTGSICFRVGANGTVTLNGSASSWAGDTRFLGGASAILKNGTHNALSTGSALSMGFSSLATAITYDLNGFNQTVAGLANVDGINVGASNTLTNNGTADSTLTLDATTDRSFSGSIADGATNKVNLVKQGTFVQTLTGTSTTTGTITVSAGTLLVNSPGGTGTGSGAVTVTAGGTLGGTGIIDGTITAAGTIAPGAMSIGTLFTAGVTLSGTYACEVDGISADLIDSIGNLNLTGCTINVIPSGVGLTETSYVVAVYTGTLTGTPTLTGAPGYSVDTNTPGEVRLVNTGLSGYDLWASNFTGFDGPNTGPAADFDQDGTTNLMEFVLGGDPRVSDSSIQPKLQITPTDFVFSFKRSDASQTDTTQVFEWGSSLMSPWTEAAVPATSSVVNGASFTITPGSPADDISVSIPRGANTTLFGRLKASKP